VIKTLALVIAATTAGLALTQTATAADTLEAVKTAPEVITFTDCEDNEQTPCYTLDEGRWVIVTSYDPYEATEMTDAEVYSAMVGRLPDCEYEDSSDCRWVASESGNGEGQSFIDIDGTVYYENP